MSQLTTNTTTIDELITIANGLPDAGSGELELQEKTVSPATSSQEVIADDGYDGLSKVTVNAIPSSYVEPTATKAATTYTPTTSNQTITAGTYCSGTQTIKGDTNLKAANIAKGVSIFGVTGTLEGGEDVSAETVEYTSLLTDLETTIDALPEAGSGGGADVETCTVTISCFRDITALATTVLNNGVITPYGSVGVISSPVTIENVVCGSAIFFNNHYELNGYTIEGDTEIFFNGYSNKGAIFRAPLTGGSNATITVYDND